MYHAVLEKGGVSEGQLVEDLLLLPGFKGCIHLSDVSICKYQKRILLPVLISDRVGMKNYSIFKKIHIRIIIYTAIQ